MVRVRRRLGQRSGDRAEGVLYSRLLGLEKPRCFRKSLRAASARPRGAVYRKVRQTDLRGPVMASLKATGATLRLVETERWRIERLDQSGGSTRRRDDAGARPSARH